MSNAVKIQYASHTFHKNGGNHQLTQCVCIYMYIYTHICIYLYIYIYWLTAATYSAAMRRRANEADHSPSPRSLVQSVLLTTTLFLEIGRVLLWCPSMRDLIILGLYQVPLCFFETPIWPCPQSPPRALMFSLLCCSGIFVLSTEGSCISIGHTLALKCFLCEYFEPVYLIYVYIYIYAYLDPLGSLQADHEETGYHLPSHPESSFFLARAFPQFSKRFKFPMMCFILACPLTDCPPG